MLRLSRFKKQELAWLDTHYCKHGHKYSSHLNCIETEKPDMCPARERVGILDIETEDLNADYGIVFSYCFKIIGEKKIYYDIVSPEDFKKYERKINGQAIEDTRIIKHLLEDLKNADRIVGHYSSGFDLPFMRTRAVICGLEFPYYGDYVQSDTWMILKKKFKLSRNSLDNGVRNLTGKSNKNHLSLNLKHGIILGKKWAQDYCLEHNKRDVLDTERLYLKIRNYAKINKSSI